MRDDTHHCTRVVPIRPNIVSRRERLGTQSQRAKSRLVIFPFYEWTKKHRDRLQRLRASFVDSALAAFNRKRSCRCPNHVERKPKGMKSSSRSMNSHIKSVVPPTPQAEQNGYMCEDGKDMVSQRKSGNTGSQPAGGLPTQTEIALVVISTVGA